MYEKILVAVDLSKLAPRVLEAARNLALLSHGEVWIVHLREREVLARGSVMIPRESLTEAEEAVNAAVIDFLKDGIKTHGVVRNALFGHAASEIISDAQDHGVDVIVMGSKGHGDLAGLLLGSTAHKVIHLADRPVLVVR